MQWSDVQRSRIGHLHVEVIHVVPYGGVERLLRTHTFTLRTPPELSQGAGGGVGLKLTTLVTSGLQSLRASVATLTCMRAGRTGTSHLTDLHDTDCSTNAKSLSKIVICCRLPRRNGAKLSLRSNVRCGTDLLCAMHPYRNSRQSWMANLN